ncbi:Leucine-rich repeat-containing protein 16C [Rhizoctonia solani]|uniref:Leucine-rich repeat-containing protein 16C n=1 Tax=Rhizoctonia solani TaxID=456999 RepID=A0A0K6GD32_9AGAM|nr:Leucine-rich repeat-containing protein 16C [Rhizoctonia solani]
MATALFNQIKPLCISLFKSSDPTILHSLYQILRSAPPSAFTPSLIEYTFFPLSHLLRKPHPPLEPIFLCLSLLSTHWDLSHSPDIWTQLVILCNLAHGKDEETCLAACLVLRALFLSDAHPLDLPIIGKTLDSVLDYTMSPNHTLQTESLQVLLRIIQTFPSEHVPSVLPGVVSKSVRVAMGDKTTSQAIGLALSVLETVLDRGIGDKVCVQSGAIRDYTTLDDLLSDPTPSGHRSPVWLGATCPQVHIALLSLSPLSTHPNPLARRALVKLCTGLVHSCAQTLQQSQPLLVSHLLTLAYPALERSEAVPEDAHQALDALQSVDVNVVAGIVAKALSLLPHRLSHTHQSTASALAKQLVSACHVLPSSTVGALLGPEGGIEKWGRTLLSVVAFDSIEHQIVQLSNLDETVEPRLEGLDRETTECVVSLFRALGKRAGDQGVFAIEWFVGAGVGGSVAGLWCALCLLDGIRSAPGVPTHRVVKATKWIAKTLAEMWDDQFLPPLVVQEDKLELTEYVKGLNPLTTLLDRPRSVPKRDTTKLHSDLAIRLIVTCHSILTSYTPTVSSSAQHPTYASSVTTNPSITLLQYTIYPMLVQNRGLNQVSSVLGYARVENMLLANFDYALEAVARRVSVFGAYAAGLHPTPHSSNGPSISTQALETLRTLVRLVGSEIVSRASDVLDQCFDRLDDFHGYERVVGALVGVLLEVVEVVGREDDGLARVHEREPVREVYRGWDGFIDWWNARNKTDENWEFDLKDEKRGDDEPEPEPEPEQDEPAPLPPTQSLTRQIIARCTYFLTHPSPYIRFQILHLLATAAPTLRASALLPTIHASWPFILNRMEDGQVWVVSACARLVETLVECVGEFMARRVWEDVWPRFEKVLKAQADGTLVRRARSVGVGVGVSYGPRALAELHVSILGTLAKAVDHVEPSDQAIWSLLLLSRRFLTRRGGEKREEVYAAAVEMYRAVGKRNPDVVWLVLNGMKGEGLPGFLKWQGEPGVFEGVEEVLRGLD